MPTPQYHVTARTDNSLYWSAYLFCGLYDLVQEGVVSLAFKPRLSLSPRETICTLLDVTETRRQQRRVVAIDWRDNADILAGQKLAECDLYYKRNYVSSLLPAVCPPEFRHKLRPLGLYFTVRGDRERPLWVRWIGGMWRQDRPLIHSSLPATLRNLEQVFIKQPRMVVSLPRVEKLERAQWDSARNAVLFQVKAFNPVGSTFPEDTRAVTEERAEIIRALRGAFPDQFVGGFVPDRYVREHYPDCVTPEKTDHDSYFGLLTTCKIGVYVRGLRSAPAYRLGEYMASGRCILMQRMRTELPCKLREGEEVLYFDSTAELVEKLRRLLADHELQERLSHGARAYYEAEVKPKRRVLRILQEAFADLTCKACGHENAARA